jgi:superfamily II DNA/RNA helicase
MLHSFIKEELQQEAEMLYAELKTEERTAALDGFSRGAARILICSELGSRGLDFSLPVDCIVEYDMA